MNSYGRQFNHISAKSLEDHLPDNNVNTEHKFPQRLCRGSGNWLNTPSAPILGKQFAPLPLV
jgi:hypothetical protein